MRPWKSVISLWSKLDRVQLLNMMECAFSNLAIDNDRAVDVGADHSLAKSVKVLLQRCSRVAAWDAIMSQFGELFLESLNDVMKSLQLFDFHFRFFLVDVNDLDFTTIVSGSLFENFNEFGFFGLNTSA